MHKALTIFVACLLVGLVSAPASALGQGNSGVDEYTEDIPGGGNNPGGNTGGDDAGTGPSTLSPGQEAALVEQGSDGAAAANLANETGPGRNGKGENSTGSSGGSEIDAAPASNGGGSAFDDVVEAVTGSDEGGMGMALPIVLILTLIVAVAAIAARRSRQGHGA